MSMVIKECIRSTFPLESLSQRFLFFFQFSSFPFIPSFLLFMTEQMNKVIYDYEQLIEMCNWCKKTADFFNYSMQSVLRRQLHRYRRKCRDKLKSLPLLRLLKCSLNALASFASQSFIKSRNRALNKSELQKFFTFQKATCQWNFNVHVGSWKNVNFFYSLVCNFSLLWMQFFALDWLN